MDSVDYKSYKVAVCGAQATGKTSLCARLTNKHMNFNYCSTIGVDLMIKYLPEYKAKIQFWDLAGSERFDIITNPYIKSADIVIFVYNLQDDTTVEKIKNKHLYYYSHNYSFTGIVVGTHNNNKIYNILGEKFAKDNNYPHFKVELEKNYDVENILNEIINILIEKELFQPNQQSDKNSEQIQQSPLNQFKKNSCYSKEICIIM